MNMHERRTWIADELTRVLRLDVRFYGRAFAWLSIGHVSGIIRGLATTFLMARWLTPVALGQFRYILALFGIAGIFALSGMNAAVIRAVAVGDTVVVWVALRRILLIAPLGAFALVLAAGERVWAGDATAAWGLVIAAVAFVPYSLSGFYGLILTGQEKIKELSRIAMANNVLYALAFVAVLRLDRSLIAIALAYFGFDVLFRGTLTIRALRKLPRQGQLRDHLKLGNQLSAIGVMQIVVGQLDQLLVQRFGGYQTLALYSIASVIPEQIKDVVNSVNGTFLQRMSRHKKTLGRVRAAQWHFWIACAGSAVVVAGYALIAPIILPWLFPQYGTAPVGLSMVYALGLLAMPAAVGLYFLQAHSELPRLWRFYITNTVLQLITAVALIPLFGNVGAVWAKTITRLGGLPFSYPRVRRSDEEAVTDAKTAR